MHPKNSLVNGYNFQELADEYTILKPFLIRNEHGKYSLDFSKRESNIVFNKVLLAKYYNIRHWNVPDGHLCPTVPGRADYLHYLKDIIGEGPKKLLDIGTGATLIYPLLGHRLFDWQFVASEVDKNSITHARDILMQNQIDKKDIELRIQNERQHMFRNIVLPTDDFDACICNPPFFETNEQALRWNQKKWKTDIGTSIGTVSELVYTGGEKAFIKKMIEESIFFSEQIKLFSCLVSKKASIPFIEKACHENKIRSLRFIEMKTGRKISRVAVWKF